MRKPKIGNVLKTKIPGCINDGENIEVGKKTKQKRREGVEEGISSELERLALMYTTRNDFQLRSSKTVRSAPSFRTGHFCSIFYFSLRIPHLFVGSDTFPPLNYVSMVSSVSNVPRER